VALAALLTSVLASDPQTTGAEKERKLVAVLQSSAPPSEKAIACKQLAIYGSPDAVPALRPLLADRDLASWARIALEVIPGPAPDGALREALGTLRGRLLIGVINSIGVRRDARAVEPLVAKLKDADHEIASAAAVALGHIGGAVAAKALQQALPGADNDVKPALAEGCILAAERFLGEGKRAESERLYDLVRQAQVPKQRIVEATRGAILARQSRGLALLLENLRADDRAMVAMALRTARELPGPQVSKALAAELSRTRADRQAFLVMALADRGDDAVWPAILQLAKSGSGPSRRAAVMALETWGNVAAIPALLDAAAGAEPDLAKSAKAALTRLPGQSVDEDICARLPQADSKSRQVLIDVAAQRHLEKAVPVIARYARDSDPGVRAAATAALGAIGKEPQGAELVKALQETTNPKDRQDLEKALVALGGRCGPSAAPLFRPLTQSSDSVLRVIALHALAASGGPEALAAVKAALADSTAPVQDEAVSTLSTWANNWPEDPGVVEPLLTLAKSANKEAHRLLGLRGYLLYFQDNKKLKDDEKLAGLEAVAALITRPEEKRMAIALLATVPNVRALESLVGYAADAGVVEEACVAIVASAARPELQASAKDLCQKALRTVLEQSKSDATKKKATAALQRLQ
jgi:HEAT repeat protein